MAAAKLIPVCELSISKNKMKQTHSAIPPCPAAMETPIASHASLGAIKNSRGNHNTSSIHLYIVHME